MSFFFLKNPGESQNIFTGVVERTFFFLQYKDNIFFCCLQTFFITGLTFFTHPFHPDPENKLLGCANTKKTKKNLEDLKIGEK